MIGSVEKFVSFAYNLCYDNNNYVSSNLLSRGKNPIIWLKQAKHLLVQKKMPMLYVYMHTQHFYLFNPIAQTKRGLRRRNDDIYKQWGNELTLRFYVDQHKMILLKDTIVISIQISRSTQI